MLNWDDIYRRKLKKLGIKSVLYARYVDDVVSALHNINKGWTYNIKKDRMEYTKLLEESDTRSAEIRTAEVMVMIANSIDSNILYV